MTKQKNKKKTVDVILRTHDGKSVHHEDRIVKAPKSEIVLRCANSLVKAIKKADATINLIVVDDHSTGRSSWL